MNHMMQINKFILPALLVLLLFQPLHGAEARKAKRILVLYSHDKAHPAHELTDHGIREAIRSNKLFDVQIYTEYLDSSRFGDPSHACIWLISCAASTPGCRSTPSLPYTHMP